MKSINYSLLFVLALSTSTVANAADSKMRITCEGDDVGAEVLINGKFRGECPIDITVPAGRLKLVVRKDVDADHEKVFEQDIHMAEDSAKKVEAVLTTTRLNAAAQKREDQRLAKATFRDCADCPEMVAIPPGSFEMGSDDYDSEKPVHRVSISRSFALGKTEVTQGQWKAIMGNNPSKFSNCGDNCPVEHVSWDDAQEFIRKLNAKTGKQYRLPSDAEWEYSERAGSTTTYPWGEQASHEYANYGTDKCCAGLAQGRDQWVNTSPAGSFPANAFGLYDMSGNVSEWVEDSYHDSYDGAPTDGSAWVGDGAKRVLRGGSWFYLPQYARSASRSRFEPAHRDSFSGFRLARMLP